MPTSFTEMANQNLTIEDHTTSILVDKIDLRNLINVGNNVIMGSCVEIITISYNIAIQIGNIRVMV